MGRRPIPGVGAHARDRMAERLGRDLTRAEWLDAVAAILDRKAALLLADPATGHEHYLLELGAVRVRMVWRPDLAMVVTVMPAEMALSARADRAKAGGVRLTLPLHAKFSKGKRLPARTCWLLPEERG